MNWLATKQAGTFGNPTVTGRAPWTGDLASPPFGGFAFYSSTANEVITVRAGKHHANYLADL